MELLRKIFNGFMVGVSLLWFSLKAITGHGAAQIFAIVVLAGVAAIAGLTLHERLHPQPKKRRAREQDDPA